MDSQCEKIQNQMADYILGILNQEKVDALKHHISECEQCRAHLQSLEKEKSLLTQFSQNIDAGMDVRCGRAISALSTLKDYTTEKSIWRIIMHKKITKFAAAAVIIVAVLLVISFLDNSVTPAYAVDQTADAIREVKTVYMAGEFYMQGQFECWMKYDGDPDRPTHVWLGRAGHNLCKVCSPAGVFGLNKRTNRVHFALRDERSKDWIFKFGSFFNDIVKKAEKSDSINIDNEIDSSTGKEIIAVLIKTSKREQKFLVDPETKLPLSFSTIRDDNPLEMMKMTLVVKNLTEIRYNELPPEGIFDLPDDAVIVEEEVDCMVDPDSGLIADGMTRQEACLEIAKQTGRALVDLDIETLCKLDLFFRLYPPLIWEQIKTMKENGQWVKEVVIKGEPYQEGELWYVPIEIQGQNGKNEVQNAMIKFYEMEGKTFCFIIGSKEKGVVD
ncbi:MAG: zf-HC2 domain-containing protein [Sedimentisphaerales bacterium]|nr:zf-HC2 domain-containing protein [Sedimentisphaerales bacterium]